MNTIYLVNAGFDYEGSSLKKSFLSLAAAEAYIASVLGKTGHDFYQISSLDASIDGGEPTFIKEVKNVLPLPKEGDPDTITFRITDIEYDNGGISGPDYPTELTITDYAENYACCKDETDAIPDLVAFVTGFYPTDFKYSVDSDQK